MPSYRASCQSWMEISLLSIFSLSATLDKIAAWSHTWTIGPYGIQKSILKEVLRASPTAKQNAFTWFRISLNLTHQLQILHSYMVNQSITQSEAMLKWFSKSLTLEEVQVAVLPMVGLSSSHFYRIMSTANLPWSTHSSTKSVAYVARSGSVTVSAPRLNDPSEQRHVGCWTPRCWSRDDMNFQKSPVTFRENGCLCLSSSEGFMSPITSYKYV